MSLHEFAKLVEKTRLAQKNYYDCRTQTNLVIAKQYEKMCDKAVEEVLRPQPPRLFDEKM